MSTVSEFRGEYRFLSNFYHSPMKVLGIPFLNCESAYMACKTLDINTRKEFSNLSPLEAKKRSYKVKLRPNWDDLTKIECMELCLRSKFCYNPNLADKLIKTNDMILIEGNNWNDTFWGVCNNKGKNILGVLLMEIRDSLK
jgi:ribA/ribD-fused uncharacterized protein